MLFLAITLGFLVENQREHYIEHRREKQFMVSLINDLKADTFQLSNIISYRENRLRRLDSIIRFFSQQNLTNIPIQGYTLTMQLFGLRNFYQNSGTLDQLKNSGGLRLIRRRNVVDSIQKYDREVKRMLLRDEYETQSHITTISLCEKLFDGRLLTRLYLDTLNPQIQVNSSALIPINEQFIDEFLNHLRHYRMLLIANIEVEVDLQHIAKYLIHLIKTEYKLN